MLVDIPDALDELRKVRGEPTKKLEAIPLEDDPKKMIQISVNLKSNLRDKMIKFLWVNADIFAQSTSDMPGIPTDMIIYKLNMDPNFKSVQQKKRSFILKRQKAIDEKDDKLLKIRFIRKAHYPKWIANVVMIKKANDKWRICIDYKDLNKACPKDNFFSAED